MIYVTSDLHGYPTDRFWELLYKANFGDKDYLFVLGDVIDRNGDGGVELLRWMMFQSNVELILGNHEAMLLACSFLFEEITDASIQRMTEERVSSFANWLSNGAEPTLKALQALRRREPDAIEAILDYLRECPLYDTVSSGGRDYLLVHSGLDHFDVTRKLTDYQPNELLWCRPKADQRYYENILTILGHTPTKYYGSVGRAFHTPTWIGIDTGAASGGAPMLLCLDDMREIYADQTGL